MNDPFECLWILDTEIPETELNKFKEFCSTAKNKTLLTVSSLKNEKIIDYINTLRKGYINKWAFCSLSEDPLDILMWSHYAKAHKGIVIGFEFSEIFDQKIFQKVEYKDKLETWNLMEWARFMEGDDSLAPVFLKDISVKHSSWNYEKEWRIWRTEPCYYYFRKEEIKEIYFGLRSEADTKRIIGKLIDMPEDIKIFEIEVNKEPLKLIR